MFLNIILIVVILISLGIISFILIRKLPKVRALDVSTVPAARKAEVRDRILLERMKRSSAKSKELVSKSARPLFQIIVAAVKKLFLKVYDLESKYKKEAESKSPLKSGELKSKVKNLLFEAQKLARDEKFQEAEKIYIEIVSLDPRNVEAYDGLSDIYIEMKEYQQALQTTEFILKLEKKNSVEVEKVADTGEKYKTYNNAHELADIYTALGYIYQMMDNTDLAAENYYEALRLEPNNPRNISQMIEIYILQNKKIQALDLLENLERVNPENQKLKEFRDQITDL